MKAKDLAVGGEYYYSSSNNWLNRSYGGELAVVVDPVPGNWNRDKNGEWQRSASTRGARDVLVRLFSSGSRTDTDGNPLPGRMCPVPTQNLRGPYAPCIAQREEQARQRHNALRDAREAQRLRLDACAQAVDGLAALGITARTEGYAHSDYASVVISDDQAALLAAAARHLLASGWQPPTE